MLVSFPLLAGHRAIARDIAASGVSDIEDDAVDAARAPRITTGERVGVQAWRSPSGHANPYLTPAPSCPECGTMVVRASGCIGCPACGWGKCG